jgi:hypothetical protein
MDFKDLPRIGYKKWILKKLARGFRLKEGRPREAFWGVAERLFTLMTDSSVTV